MFVVNAFLITIYALFTYVQSLNSCRVLLRRQSIGCAHEEKSAQIWVSLQLISQKMFSSFSNGFHKHYLKLNLIITSSRPEIFSKKVFLKMLQNSQEIQLY